MWLEFIPHAYRVAFKSPDILLPAVWPRDTLECKCLPPRELTGWSPQRTQIPLARPVFSRPLSALAKPREPLLHLEPGAWLLCLLIVRDAHFQQLTYYQPHRLRVTWDLKKQKSTKGALGLARAGFLFHLSLVFC